MKNLIFLFAAFVLGSATSLGASMGSTGASFGNTRSFIFTEGDVTFSVYPDGEFDFYLNGQMGVQAGVFANRGGITFNSGFNYNPYVQYDDFGAIIQIAQLPVFYDYYGRVNRIGNIHMNYRNGQLYRLGGMRIFYNGLGYYNYHVGYINPFNQVYIYQPFHRYFARPVAGFCMVYPQPYRRYYNPVRYTYHSPYHQNTRRAYAHVGKPVHYQQRPERSRVYQNTGRVAPRTTLARSGPSRSITAKETGVRTNRTVQSQKSSLSRTTSARSANSATRINRSVEVQRPNRAKSVPSSSSSATAQRTSRPKSASTNSSSAAQRASRAKTAGLSTPYRTERQSVASRSAGKVGAKKQVADRKRSQTVKRSMNSRASRETVSRSASAVRSGKTTLNSTSRRSSGY